MRRSARRAACSFVCVAVMMQWNVERVMADSATDAAFAKLRTDCAGGMAALTNLANAGNNVAEFDMGILYGKEGYRDPTHKSCLDFAPDVTKEIYWLTKSGDAGNSDAAASLGEMYEEGSEVPADQNEMGGWYSKAATEGDSYSQSRLVKHFSDGSLPLPTDPATLKWIAALANSFNGAAMTVVGMFLEQGINPQGATVAKNPTAALQWYEGAAKAGDAQGAYRAGMMLLTAAGVPADPSTANVYLGQAAQAGLTAAQAQLAYDYEEGAGVAAEPSQAFAWYLKAAGGGSVYAEAKVASDYEFGTGVAVDNKQAAAWATPAANGGSAEGEYILGKEYLAGLAMPTDDSLGMQWLQKAADQGYADAQTLIDKIKDADANPMGNIPSTNSNQLPTAQQFLGALLLLGTLAATSHTGSSGGSTYTPPASTDNSTSELQQLQQQQQDDEANQQRQQEENDNNAQQMEEQQQQEMQQYNAEQGVNNGN